MKRYTILSTNVADGVLYLTLKPSRHTQPLHFTPGQYLSLSFKAGLRRSPARCFSIVSNNQDLDQLSVAVKINGAYTQTLAELAVGSRMYVQGPFGSFSMNNEYDRHVVMIAGGIGVTPFISMIRSAEAAGFPVPMSLLYSYRTGHDIPFYDELTAIASHSRRFRFVAFVTNASPLPPNRPRLLSGRMNEDHIRQVTRDADRGSTYFICGPESFTANTVQLLRAHGVHDDRIITESFTQAAMASSDEQWSPSRLTYAFSTLLLLAGVAVITFLDLSRYAPHYVQASRTVTNSAAASPAASGSASANSIGNSTTNATASPPTTSYSQNPPTQQTYYSPPVTSVS